MSWLKRKFGQVPDVQYTLMQVGQGIIQGQALQAIAEQLSGLNVCEQIISTQGTTPQGQQALATLARMLLCNQLVAPNMQNEMNNDMDMQNEEMTDEIT